MTKGSGTRSGLLWEVERLLNECEELPQILVMENVPQVHSKANMPDFQKWLDFLESKGYSNYWKDLNAKNFGVAQNRNRCFCVSLLGDYKYEFPEEIPLTKVMKDYLEDEVDKKYYITSEKAKLLIDKLILDGKISNRQTDKQTNRQLTCAANKQKQLNCVTQSKPDIMQESQTSNMTTVESVNGKDLIEQIEKFGNKNGNYFPFDGAVSYPMHSQDFVRTGFMQQCPTLASRDYKDPKIVCEMEKLNARSQSNRSDG